MDMNLILASIAVFLIVILLLVVILLVAKKFLVPSGNVKVTINGEKELEVGDLIEGHPPGEEAPGEALEPP